MNADTCMIKTDKSGLELTKHGNSDFPIAYYSDLIQNVPVNWHWHEELELIYIENGTAIVAIESENYVVEAGNGFFVNSGILHSVWSQDKCVCDIRSIVFHSKLIGGDINSIFFTKYINPIINNPNFKGQLFNLNTPWQKESLNILKETLNLCRNINNGYEWKVRNLLSDFTYSVFNNISLTNDNISDKNIRDNTRIKLMLQFINDNFSENITIKQIADSASVSESEALRCFHRAIHTTPIQYLKSYRLKKAAELLTASSLKIIDIGIMCGFQDMSYFSKSFAKIYGITPSKYREKNNIM